MATHDYVIDNASGSAVRTDLNNVFQAILTNNSSGSAPSTTAAYMFWADTSNNVLKIRNSGNSDWVELFQLDGTLTLEDGSASTPALAFRDDLNSGIFSSAADTVDVSCGGTTRGSFSSSGLTVTGNVTATTFVGDVDANNGDFDGTLEADAITVGGTALNTVIAGVASTNVTVADESSDTTCFPLFVTAATGDLPPKSGSNLSFNSSSGKLTATSFAGDGSELTGLSSGGVTSDAQSNTIAGSGAGDSFSGTDAEENTLYGKDCGENITTGDNNTAMGRAALHDNQTKSNITAIGHNCLNKCIQNNSTAVGSSAGAALTTGTYFTAVGAYAADAVTDGYSMTAVGYNTCGQMVSGGACTAVGHEALRYQTAGASCTAVGNKALENVTTSSNHTAVGSGAARYVTTATNITVVGMNAGYAKQTGDSLTAVGSSCLRQATGNDNTAMGNNAAYALTTGTNNTVMGHYAQMLHNVSNNTMIGEMSGYDTSGSGNTALGQGTLTGCSGSNNTCIGQSAATSASDSSNQMTLGNASINNLRCADTSISSLSDRRDKTDIVDLPVGLDLINKVRAVKFKWQTRDKTESKDGTIRGGFIAQELQEVMTDFDASWLDLVHDENPEKLEAKQGKLIPVLVKAIQELSVKVTALEAG
tara:strand:- start:314 stop:2257 length:1944 start_codon:yes stop_codon:yes gene_type:complete